MKIIEMDEKVSLSTQLQHDVGTVIQITRYTVNPDDVEQFLARTIGNPGPDIVAIGATVQCAKLVDAP